MSRTDRIMLVFGAMSDEERLEAIGAMFGRLSTDMRVEALLTLVDGVGDDLRLEFLERLECIFCLQCGEELPDEDSSEPDHVCPPPSGGVDELDGGDDDEPN